MDSEGRYLGGGAALPWPFVLGLAAVAGFAGFAAAGESSA